LHALHALDRRTTGGVEIMLTSFLNLVNDDWLRRADRWTEGLILVFTGRLAWRRIVPDASATACVCAAVIAVAVMLGRGLMQLFHQLLVSVAGDCWRTSALRFAWALVVPKPTVQQNPSPRPGRIHAQAAAAEELPEIPGYELLPSPFGKALMEGFGWHGTPQVNGVR
jgi:hypothetical protein